MSKLNHILLVISGLLLGCNDDAATHKIPSTAPSQLVSATLLNQVSLNTIKSFVSGYGQTKVAAMLNYGIDTYRIVYNTTYQGKTIAASGLLMIPSGIKQAAPLLGLQHGTTFLKSSAPSSTGTYSGTELFASAGYVALMPDFIGYGESSQVFHPYYDKNHSALTVIDMIKAIKDFLKEKNIACNDQLFLAGYSEGGYVTLAAAKEIEMNPQHNLKVTAVAAGAGGYDLTAMLKGVTSSKYYAYPAYLAFVLKAYNITNQWNLPMDTFFAPQYAKAVDQYLDGKNDGWQINSKLTTSVYSLLNEDFIKRLKSHDGEQLLKQTLQENSVTGWETQLPIRLYHGTQDEIIPFQNSESTLQSFKDAGGKNVSLTLIPNSSHGSSFLPMLQAFVPWFEQLRTLQ